MSAPRNDRDLTSLIGFILIGLIVVYFFFPPPTPPTPESGEVAEKAEESDLLTGRTERALEKALPKASMSETGRFRMLGKTAVEEISVETERVRGTFSNQGAVWTSLYLKDYFQTNRRKSPVRLISAEEHQTYSTTYRINGVSLPENMTYRIIDRGEGFLLLEAKTAEFLLRKRVEFIVGGYATRETDQFQNLTHKRLEIEMVKNFVQTPAKQQKTEERGVGSLISGLFSMYTKDIVGFVVILDGSSKRFNLVPGETAPGETLQSPITWAGVETRYFVRALVPEKTRIEQIDYSQLGTDLYQQKVHFFARKLEPTQEAEIVYVNYFGPKKIDDLIAASTDLDKAINYGDWVGFIARFLLRILLYLGALIGNYGIAIILLTMLVKLVTFPLNQKQYKSMRAMSALQPKMNELRERYKNDKHQMNMAMMQLFKEHKVNPMGGCFPLLIQLPIFFALYRVFYNSIELRHSPFGLWIHDLSVPDPWLVTPVLMTLFMVLQQKLTPTPSAAGNADSVRIQQAMMKTMPLMFGIFGVFLPAGLCLYILVNAGLSIVQQRFLGSVATPAGAAANSSK